MEHSASRCVTFSLVIFPQVTIKKNMKKEHPALGEGHKLEIDSTPHLNLLRNFPKLTDIISDNRCVVSFH